MGRSNDPGRRLYSALNLRIDFGTEVFFVLISEPFGLQVEKRWLKCLRRTEIRDGQIWRVRFAADQTRSWNQFSSLAYIFKR